MPNPILLTFCNCRPPGFALGIYEYDSGNFMWIPVDALPEGVIGATGLARAANGGWYFLFNLKSGGSGLAHLDDQLGVTFEGPLTRVRDPHSLVARQGGVVVASSGTNQVIRLERATNGWSETPIWSAADAGSDTVHLNSLAYLDGNLCVSIFGQNNSEGWSKAIHGSILDTVTGEELASDQHHPHSLRNIGSSLLWAESGRSRINRYTRDAGAEQVAKVHGYIRGLVANDTELLVAASGARRRSRSTGTQNTSPTNPRDLQTWLFRIEVDTGSVQEKPLTPFGAEIYDLEWGPDEHLPDHRDTNEAVTSRFWAMEDEAYEAVSRATLEASKVGKLAQQNEQARREIDRLQTVESEIQSLKQSLESIQQALSIERPENEQLRLSITTAKPSLLDITKAIRATTRRVGKTLWGRRKR